MWSLRNPQPAKPSSERSAGGRSPNNWSGGPNSPRVPFVGRALPPPATMAGNARPTSFTTLDMRQKEKQRRPHAAPRTIAPSVFVAPFEWLSWLALALSAIVVIARLLMLEALRNAL